MASITTWYEQNGQATGTPAHGTESAISSCDWKSVDDTTTPRVAAPILAGNNSFIKYIYLRFSGTFNQISGVKFSHNSGTLGQDIRLKGKVTSVYETPTDAAITGATDITEPTPVSYGASVLLGTDPNSSNPSASMTTACSTQYIATQLQVGPNANSGDSGTANLWILWFEN